MGTITHMSKFPNPRGSEYPNSKVLGPKIHTLNGFWTLKPYYLGTWTLRASASSCVTSIFCTSLRVHVLNYYILWPQCSYIGTTLRPMYILYEYMDPYGFRPKSILRVFFGPEALLFARTLKAPNLQPSRDSNMCNLCCSAAGP